VRYTPLIAKLTTVGAIQEADVEKLMALCDDERVVQAKQDILTEGERPDHVHVILEGWAARYKTLADGSRQIVAFLIPGDFCDLHIAILGHMDHGIVALTRCRVAYIPSADLDVLTSHHNGLTKALWWSTLVDEGVLREWILNVGRRGAFERIGHLLCEMHARMEMVGLVEGNRLALPLTQEQLADATDSPPCMSIARCSGCAARISSRSGAGCWKSSMSPRSAPRADSMAIISTSGAGLPSQPKPLLARFLR
jgi:CRP-like cAMP-binding protein